MSASFLIALFSGVLFSFGLVVSGMTNPAKVKNFLDVFGEWDSSLIFVMVGAVVFNFVSFRVLQARQPFCAPKHYLPTKSHLDKSLLIGSALFGVGWGLSGICPGPGLVNLVTGKMEAIVFVASMLVGMIGYELLQKYTLKVSSKS